MKIHSKKYIYSRGTLELLQFKLIKKSFICPLSTLNETRKKLKSLPIKCQFSFEQKRAFIPQI